MEEVLVQNAKLHAQNEQLMAENHGLLASGEGAERYIIVLQDQLHALRMTPHERPLLVSCQVWYRPAGGHSQDLS